MEFLVFWFVPVALICSLGTNREGLAHLPISSWEFLQIAQSPEASPGCLSLSWPCSRASIGSQNWTWALGYQDPCTVIMIFIIHAVSFASRNIAHSPSNALGFFAGFFLLSNCEENIILVPRISLSRWSSQKSPCGKFKGHSSPNLWFVLCWEIWTGHFITDCVYSLFCSFACFLLLFDPALRIHNFTVFPSHNSAFVNTNDSAYSNFSATVGEELLGFLFCICQAWLDTELTLSYGSSGRVVKVLMFIIIIIIVTHYWKSTPAMLPGRGIPMGIPRGDGPQGSSKT